MNTNTDYEFLYWVSKRLLYKYKEDTKIVRRIENIAKELYAQARNFDNLSKKDYNEVNLMFK